MKVVFFSRLFYPHIGGVEKHVYEISRQLILHGHIVTIITECFDRSLSKKEIYQGITIYRVPVGSEQSKKYQIWGWLLNHLNILLQADIIHCHDVFFWYFPFRFLLPSKKIYTTFHGYEGRNKPTQKAKIIRRLSNKLSIGTINVGDFIEKWYGTKPTFVIYGAVNKIPESETRHTIKKTLNILFIGRIAEDTGVELYIQVLEQLKRENIFYTFQVVGDGSYRPIFEPYGTVYGFKEDIGKYIKKADIIFASSYLSILQAMSYKKFVVAVYNNPLKEDYLKMTPFAKWIVVSNDPLVVTNKIKQYSQDPKAVELIQKQAAEFVQKQTWEVLTNLYLKLWRI